MLLLNAMPLHPIDTHLRRYGQPVGWQEAKAVCEANDQVGQWP